MAILNQFIRDSSDLLLILTGVRKNSISLIWQRMRGIHAYLRKAPSAVVALRSTGLCRTTRSCFTTLCCTSVSPRNTALPRWIFLSFGMLLVRTLINLWPSFHKNDTVSFQEIPISSSCFLSEVDHFAWMTCLSTSTRAGCWRPESRFHAQNIGSQSFWENVFANYQNENSTDLVFFFCLSSLSNGSQDRLPSPFFRNVALETARMRCQMRLLFIRTRVCNAWSLHYGSLARRNFK